MSALPMRCARSTALACLTLLMLAGAARRARAQVVPQLSLSVGPATASSQTIDGNSQGWGGNAALWLSIPRVPVGLRADAALYRFAERRFHMLCAADRLDPRGFAPGCGSMSYRDAADVGTLSLTFTLARGRISPYLLGGIGVYRLAATESHGPAPCPPGAMCIAPAVLPHVARYTSTRFGTSAGGGLAVRMGRMSLTAEARYHAYGQRSGRGHMVPVTLGVRF